MQSTTKPQVFRQYLLRESLRGNGMASVYRAVGRGPSGEPVRVAVKIASEEPFKAALIKEAQLLKALN